MTTTDTLYPVQVDTYHNSGEPWEVTAVKVRADERKYVDTTRSHWLTDAALARLKEEGALKEGVLDAEVTGYFEGVTYPWLFEGEV